MKSGILPVIENVITNFSHFFDKDNLKFYKSKVIAFNKERNVQIKIEDTSSDKLKICLFGTISVTHLKKKHINFVVKELGIVLVVLLLII